MIMFNSRSLTLKAGLFVAALGLSHVASAATISFGSTVASTTYNNLGGTGAVVQYAPTTGPDTTSIYPPAGAGTVYVTYTNTDYPATDTAPYVTTYTTTFTAPGIDQGSVTFVADDSVIVFLNGVQIGSSSTFLADTTVGLTSIAGLNTLTFQVTNNTQSSPGAADPTALNFFGSVSTTPEPSSLMLLGTGLLGVAGAARRRFLKA